MVVALVAEDVLGCIAHRLEDVLAASDGLGTGGSVGPVAGLGNGAMVGVDSVEKQHRRAVIGVLQLL